MAIIYRPKGKAAEYSHLAANLYTGCDHNCTYCYVPKMPNWRDRDFYKTPAAPRKDVIEKLRKEAPKYRGTDERVLLCFSGDPYCPLEAEYELTRRAIEIFREFDIPFQVLSKGGTLAARDFNLYGPNDAYAGTLTFLDRARSRQFEPGAAIPESRMLAMEIAHAKGIHTWVSLEPVIDADETIAIIETTHKFVDLYKIGKLNYAQSDIDWRQFAIRAIETCRKYRRDYYIKAELAEHLKDFDFLSVDNRKVNRSNPRDAIYKPSEKRKRKAGSTSLFS